MIESSFEITVSSIIKATPLASRREFYFRLRNRFTENWICLRIQTHKRRASAIYEELGEHSFKRFYLKVFYQLNSIHLRFPPLLFPPLRTPITSYVNFLKFLKSRKKYWPSTIVLCHVMSDCLV